jgi:hypothetical protein
VGRQAFRTAPRFRPLGVRSLKSPVWNEVFTRVLLHHLLEEAGADTAVEARRGGARPHDIRWIDSEPIGHQSLETIRARYGSRGP